MQIVHDEVFGIFPHSYMQFRPALTRFPTIFNVTGDCVVGNGSGYGNNAIQSALGEYVERYHFYNEVDINVTANLAKYNSPRVTNKFIKMIDQVKKSNEPTDKYEFDLTTVTNIFTGEKASLPSVMISLAQVDSADRNFIPFIDSCGQSVQISRRKAFSAALKEFVERQALVGAWLSGQVKSKLMLEQHPYLGQSNKILQSLLQHGTLLAYELNKHLPGYSVIIFYFSKSKKDVVKYSVGMACDYSPSEAIQRALSELWQSYIFMYLNADNPENLDPRYQYLNELILFNQHSTQELIPFVEDNIEELDMQDFIYSKLLSEKTCLQELKTISPDIFMYERSNLLFGRNFYFCKIFSPDFFMHMGVKMPLNFDNTYAKLLSIQKPLLVKHSIPFP
jgi:ribosomal protein S12 methylthiotransferase accessory factor YcaO